MSNVAGTARVEALDILRGLFIAIILVNHLALFPNIFMFFTGKSDLWVSAAEGFMVVSGLLVGYIYAKKMKDRAKYTSIKLLRRAFKIYIATLLLGLFAMFFVYFFGPTAPQDISFVRYFNDVGWARFIFDTLTLQFSFSWAEFLANYAIFVALSPIVLWMISKGWWWLVCIISIAIWYTAVPPASDIALFYRPNWQILFFISIVIGAYYSTITAFFARIFSTKQQTIALRTLWVVAVCIFCFSLLLTWGYTTFGNYIPGFTNMLEPFMGWWWSAPPSTEDWFNRQHLGVARIIVGAIIFWALFTAINKYHQQINDLTRGIFRVIGQRGLSAYIVHSVIVLVVLALPQITVAGKASQFIINSLYTFACLALMYVIVYLVPMYYKKYRSKQ